MVPTLKALSLPGGGNNRSRAQRLKGPGCLGTVNSLLLELSVSNMKEMSHQPPKEFAFFLKGVWEENNCMMRFETVFTTFQEVPEATLNGTQMWHQ